VRTFLAAASSVLADNKMPFFPAYTDHGVEHISRVLVSTEQLISEEAWDLLVPEDAAAIVTASILHDFAMHLREPGFVDLVAPGTRFEGRPWFAEYQGGRFPDRPWSEIWEEYRAEVRRWTTSQLARVLGPANDGVPAVCIGGKELRPPTWRDDDRFVIGEFLRRHHARLAHEIAIFGLPGAGEDFPVLRSSMGDLAEAAGAVARSHNEDLRLMADYFDAGSPGNLKPFGIHAVYVMALLRVADYVQLDADRAPTLLLRLRQPQSPQSWDEWRKHQAVLFISWENRDPRSLYFEVSHEHNLRTHLQLGELLADLQRELDTSVAVLSETYSSGPLVGLRLTVERVRTNLHEPSLHARLPYVPRRASLRSAEDLFRLVIRDLYGDQPAVAGRELLQNAVDAVRALDRWCHERRATRPADSLVETESDVTVEVVELAGDPPDLALRVRDRGIGMTPETVVDHFLQAGASYQAVDAGEQLSTDEAIRWFKVGRFGVGAFAAFLLGREIRVRTRHVSADRGVEFVASMEEDLVELRHVDMPVGTEVIVPFADVNGVEPGSGRRNPVSLLSDTAAFYALRHPTVEFHVRTPHRGPVRSSTYIPTPGGRLPDDWRALHGTAFDALLWRLPPADPWSQRGRLIHNGIVVKHPGLADPWESEFELADPYFTARWRNTALFDTPTVAVFDSRNLLGLALTRYSVTDHPAPFEDALIEDIGRDVVAFSLVAGPRPHPLTVNWGAEPVRTPGGWLPFLPGLIARYLRLELAVLIRPADVAASPKADLPSGPRGMWRTAPFRISLPATKAEDELRMGRDALEQYALDVDATVQGLRGLLSGRLDWRGAAVVEAHGEPLLPQTTDDWDSDRLMGHLEWSTDESEFPASRAAATLAEAVLSQQSSQMAACALFASCPDGAPALSKVEEPWDRMIGGPMPSSRKRREEIAATLSRRDRSFGARLNKWRRLLA
jgi:hypothetical protein